MSPLHAGVSTVDSGRRKPSAVARVLILVVRLYQMGLSPVLGWNCRFEPTCSRYMVQALARHGAVKGLALGLWRLCRCHPFSEGGYDPVP